jgi:hypothetical protein
VLLLPLFSALPAVTLWLYAKQAQPASSSNSTAFRPSVLQAMGSLCLCWLSSTDGSPATACRALELFFRNPIVLFMPLDQQVTAHHGVAISTARLANLDTRQQPALSLVLVLTFSITIQLAILHPHLQLNCIYRTKPIVCLGKLSVVTQ